VVGVVIPELLKRDGIYSTRGKLSLQENYFLLMLGAWVLIQ